MARPPRQPLLVFDGDCGFCRWWVDWWRRRTGDRVQYEPFQAAGIAQQFPEIPRERFAQAVHLIEPEGRVSAGAEAVFRLVSLWKSRVPLAMYERMPGAAALTEWAYRFVADHRPFFARVALVVPLARAIAPFRSVNSYGPFAVMTTTRPEIVIEGSNDGVWRTRERLGDHAPVLSLRSSGSTLNLMDDPAKKKSEEQWRQTLSPEQFQVLREHGTERAGTSPLNYEKRTGMFLCSGCGQPLFSSETKFESGTGWPSFWQPIEGAIETTDDRSHSMTRTEVHCSRCGGHLGHVFPDGPQPTGLRYCTNGVALEFEPRS